ncbi:MAG: hypothetical protein GC165_07970 [Armatimonadetes bacterium]|nr:hypothetical protein [Armatimonadota bacterium]
MRRTEKAAKWVIRALLGSPLFLIFGAFGFLAIDGGHPLYLVLILAAVVAVCLVLHHAEVNYGIGWPSLVRILQSALVLFVAYSVCLLLFLGWRGFGSPEYIDWAIYLFKFLMPILALILPSLLFFAPGKSLFGRWARPGEYDGD